MQAYYAKASPEVVTFKRIKMISFNAWMFNKTDTEEATAVQKKHLFYTILERSSDLPTDQGHLLMVHQFSDGLVLNSYPFNFVPDNYFFEY